MEVVAHRKGGWMVRHGIHLRQLGIQRRPFSA